MSSMEEALRRLRSGAPLVPEFRDGAIVQHVCPECGGPFAKHLDAAIIVQVCWACHGAGLMSDEELTQYERMSKLMGTGLNIS